MITVSILSQIFGAYLAASVSLIIELLKFRICSK